METKKQLNSLQKKIIPILKKNGVVKAGIFGSYARGDIKKIVMLIF
jgi:predicted nucleotidyltransferase